MAVQDFITTEEIENAPEDPAMAFAELVAHAERRLAEKVGILDQGYAVVSVEHGFMNVVVALARKFKIEPFVSLDVPRRNNFDGSDFFDFKADLDHYMTQLLVNNTIRNRRNSVLLASKDKDRIRVHIHAIKDAIDKADLSESKRADLHKKLSAFEAALEKKRLNLMDATMVTFAILGVPGSLWASAEVVGKLTHNLLEIIAEAKVVDDENRRLVPPEAPAALMPPRKEDLPKRKPGASLAEELDDEIPFKDSGRESRVSEWTS